MNGHYDYSTKSKKSWFTQEFHEYTYQELRKEREGSIAELDISCCLALLASVEAAFQTDYRRRCASIDKQNLSAKFREIQASKEKSRARPSLAGNILQAWKTCDLPDAGTFSQLRGTFEYRHWLAHGRYWRFQSSRKWDLDSVYELAVRIGRPPLWR